MLLSSQLSAFFIFSAFLLYFSINIVYNAFKRREGWSIVNLRMLRKEHNVTQQMLADHLGVTQAALSGWETGKYGIDNVNLSKIASYFNVSTDFLLGRTDDPVPLLHIPDDLKGVRVAFHRGEFEDLTQEEVDTLAIIARSLKEKRRGRDNKD
jgi:transcriptional regulator with XRE-family HTH domain